MDAVERRPCYNGGRVVETIQQRPGACLAYTVVVVYAHLRRGRYPRRQSVALGLDRDGRPLLATVDAVRSDHPGRQKVPGLHQ